MLKINNKLLIVAIGLLLVFAIDIIVPLGVAIGILYILCLLPLLSIRKIKSLYHFGIIASILIVAGMFLNDTDTISWKVICNRIISVIALWTIALIVAYYNKSILEHNLFLRQDQKRISLANTQLTNKNQELEQFTYIASHDLQEPLRTISSYTEIIRERYEDKLDDFGRKSLSFIIEATERMSALIKGLLDYSRIGKDKIAQKVDISVLLKELNDDLKTLIESNNATITYENLPTIVGYKTDLRLLFQNFITNSIKYRNENIDPIISIKCVENEKEWVFSINDNGIGIDSAYYEKIFIIFQRLHAKGEYSGTGIGLAHCQKIVHQHGGTIEVSSELGKGTNFTFNILKLHNNNV